MGQNRAPILNFHDQILQNFQEKNVLKLQKYWQLYAEILSSKIKFLSHNIEGYKCDQTFQAWYNFSSVIKL
jgi:hypothetical protein